MAVTRVYFPGGSSTCRVCRDERASKYKQTTYQTPEGRLARRAYRHGITPVSYLAMIYFQGECCAICKTANWGEKGPQVDHCHATGKVRGVLCKACNTSLGLMRDNAASLRRAADYLEAK